MESGKENNIKNSGCISCGNPLIETGHKMNLCADCRTKLSRLEIPLKIKLFALAIIALTLIGIIRMPRFISAGVHSARGEKAEEKGLYITACREFKYVEDVFPENVENNAHLIICYAHNCDLKNAFAAAERIGDKTTEEISLMNDANSCLDALNGYLPSPELTTWIDSLHTKSAAEFMDSLTLYCKHHVYDHVALYNLADKYFDAGNYHATDSIMLKEQVNDKPNIRLNGLMAATKREEKQYDSAIYYYDQILIQNQEFPTAIAGKVRVELKRHHDAEAATLARQCYIIDSTDASSMEAMALVAYFSNKQAEAQRMITRMKLLQPADSLVYARDNDIITGKTQYR